jgi:hypothetical protein
MFTFVCVHVCFPLLVSDGEHVSPEMALTIHLLPTEQQPPAFQVTAPVLKVSPGGRTSVGENWEPERIMALGVVPYFTCSVFLMVAKKQ